MHRLATQPNTTLRLWPNGAPHHVVDTSADSRFERLRRTEPSSAELKVFLPPPSTRTGVAFVVVPGGSYRPGPYGWCKKAEGTDVAEWLASVGVVGVVLDYRLPAGRPEAPLSDALRAIASVRQHAPTWGVDPAKVGVMGFSAGGHLAALATTAWTSTSIDRPDMAVLIYPVTTLREQHTHINSRREFLGRAHANSTALVDRYSAELRLNRQTPPTLLVNARDDRVVDPANSRLYWEACVVREVPCRWVELATGGHPFVNKPHAWQPTQAAITEWLHAGDFGPGRRPPASGSEILVGKQLVGRAGRPVVGPAAVHESRREGG